jgi:hypothetical protein
MSDEKAEEVKKVSKKKILFVELDEELTSIFERVETLPYKEIYLVVPKRAVLLQSMVNLKILKQKLADVDKNMAIITNDTNGMKLAHQAEVRVFDHWSVDDKTKKEEKDSNSALLKPIAASSNDVGEDTPLRLPKKKSSIFEVVRNIRTSDQAFSLKGYMRTRKKNKQDNEAWKLYLPGGTRRFVTGLVIASLALFFIIIYVVLPGATLYIEPASEVVSRGVNITLEPRPSDPRSMKAYDVEAVIDITITHPATGIISEGNNSSGELTIINTADRVWGLVPQTRFQTDNGIVFRIEKEAQVPAASAEGSPGTLVVQVVADPVDANGVPTGERGNVEPTKFVLPALREDSQDEIYAESYEAMTGGETNVSATVLEDDLIAAREKLIVALEEKALSSLRKETLSLGNREGLELVLLEDSDVLVYGNPVVDMPYSVIGDETQEFEITGSLQLTGVAYDSEAVLNILKTEIISGETPGKQLVRIDEDSISINVLETDLAASIYRFTAQIQGVEEFEIEKDLEGGSKLVKKITEHIAGRSIEEAEAYVQNLPEVNKVQIKIWPSWAPTIPSLPENIKIRSLSDGTALELE